MKLTGKKHNYTIQKPIASLSSIKFSENFIGINNTSGENVFIKRLKKIFSNKDNIVRQFVNESNPELKINGVPENLDLFESGDQLYSVRKYLQGVDLKTALNERRYRKQLDEKTVIKLFVRLTDILNELHQQHIIHCDIKPSNIFIETDSKENLMVEKNWLLDLGLAIFNKQKSTGKKNFSLIYAAPEQVFNLHELISEQTDIYMLGICLYETLSKEQPFKSDNPEFLMNLMIARELQTNKNISPALFSIVQKACSKFLFPLPPNRYTPEQLKENIQRAICMRHKNMEELKKELLLV